jgi:hypothetical protein
MTRLIVHVEGQTEELFVNEILAPHLYNHGYSTVAARLLGRARLKHNRGGIKPWPTVKSDISRHLRSDQGCIATLMVDYYALPQSGEGAWPGRQCDPTKNAQEKNRQLQESLGQDMEKDFGALSRRFIPFALMYEFEGLLFSDCNTFAQAIGRQSKAEKFQAIRNKFATPEDINDSSATAPSKRILKLVPSYEKPLYGNIAASTIGLPTIRRECVIFDRWVNQLEAAANINA